MLSRIEIFPLGDDRGIGFEIEISLTFLYPSLLQNIEKRIKYNGVKPCVLIFGADSNQPKVNSLGILSQRKDLQQCRRCQPASAFLQALSDSREAEPQSHNSLIIIAYKNEIFLIEKQHKLRYKLVLSLLRYRHRTVQMSVALLYTVEKSVSVFSKICLF